MIPNPQESRAFFLQVGQAYPGTAPLILRVAVLGWPFTLSKSVSAAGGMTFPATTTQRAWEAWTCKGCYYLLLTGPAVNAWPLSPGAALLWPHLDTPAGLHTLPTGLMAPEGWAWLDEAQSSRWAPGCRIPGEQSRLQATRKRLGLGETTGAKGPGSSQCTPCLLPFLNWSLLIQGLGGRGGWLDKKARYLSGRRSLGVGSGG